MTSINLASMLPETVWSDIIGGTNSSNYISAFKMKNKFSMRSDILRSGHITQLQGVYESSSYLQDVLLYNVAAGRYKQKKLYAFGDNDYGILGLGDKVDREEPTYNDFFEDHIIEKVSRGPGLTTLVLTNKGLYIFGISNYERAPRTDTIKPTLVDAFDGFVIKDMFIIGLEPPMFVTDKGLWYLNNNIATREPFFDGHNIKKIAGVSEAGILVLSEGSDLPDGTLVANRAVKGLYVKGYNDEGELGLGDNLPRGDYTKIDFFDDHIIYDFVTGYSYNLVWTNKGIYAFGQNNKGQLGLGLGQLGVADLVNRNTPTKIDFFDPTLDSLVFHIIKKIVAGEFSSAVLTNRGLYVFGNNIGSIPTKLDYFDDKVIKDIIKNDATLYIITGDDTVYAFTNLEEGPIKQDFYKGKKLLDILESGDHTIILTEE